MESLLYNVSFWLVLNLFLAAAVVGLILVRYSLTRNTPKPNVPQPEGVEFSSELTMFQKLSSMGQYAEAVSQTFAACFVKLCSFYGVEYKAITPKELLKTGRLPTHVGEAVKALYEVYEPVRFGRLNPTPEMLAKFGEYLERLNGRGQGVG